MDPVTALASLVAVEVVKQVVAGRPPNRDEWAGVASQMAGILIEHAQGTEDALSGIETRLDRLQLAPYEEHMAAGRSILEDLRWARTGSERERMVASAYDKFKEASGAAASLHDAALLGDADIAVAGCWLLLPHLEAAREALRRAARAVGMAMLDVDLSPPAEPTTMRDMVTELMDRGRTRDADYANRYAYQRRLVEAYGRIVKLGKAYGALDGGSAVPLLRERGLTSIGGDAPDLVIPLTEGVRGHFMGIEVCVRDLVYRKESAPPPTPATPAPPSLPPSFQRALMNRGASLVRPIPQLDHFTADIAIGNAWSQVGFTALGGDDVASRISATPGAPRAFGLARVPAFNSNPLKGGTRVSTPGRGRDAHGSATPG